MSAPYVDHVIPPEDFNYHPDMLEAKGGKRPVLKGVRWTSTTENITLLFHHVDPDKAVLWNCYLDGLNFPLTQDEIDRFEELFEGNVGYRLKFRLNADGMSINGYGPMSDYTRFIYDWEKIAEETGYTVQQVKLYGVSHVRRNVQKPD